jgi:hypothetical protein
LIPPTNLGFHYQLIVAQFQKNDFVWKVSTEFFYGFGQAKFAYGGSILGSS